MSTGKVFVSQDADGVDVELRFNKPTQKLLTKGDFVYREYFGKSVRAGLMTNAEAEKLLKDREIWSDAQEAELVQLQQEIFELEAKFEGDKEVDAETGLELYKRLKSLRADIDALANIRRSVVDNTAEAVAAEMRTQFYAAECVVYNHSGKKVFKDLADFTAKLGERLALDSYKQALFSNYESVLGIDLSKVESTDTRDVEDKWLESLTEKEEEQPEEPVEEAEVEPAKPVKKKRRPRKKKAAE